MIISPLENVNLKGTIEKEHKLKSIEVEALQSDF